MELFEELNNDLNTNPAVYSGAKKLASSASPDRFASTLKKLLNNFDSDEVIIKKVVDTALSIEFDRKIDKKELQKMGDVISGVYLQNEEFKKELLYIAKSILTTENDQKIIIN